MAGIHDYSTPKGEFIQVKNEDGVVVSCKIEWNPGFGPKLSRNFNSVQEFIDTECLRHCQPMVPKRDNILIQSGVLNTQIGSGQVEYRTPYARKHYYIPARFHEAPMRGNYWFERMKQQYREDILKGAQNLINRGMK